VINDIPDYIEYREALCDGNYDKINTSNRIGLINITKEGNNSLSINLDNTKCGDTSKKYGDKGRAIYWYYLKPRQEEGIFSTYTTARTKYYADIDVPLSIDIREPDPKFNVNLKIKKLDIYFEEELPLTYEVKYIGGSSNPCRYSILLDTDEGYTLSKSEFYNEEFNYSSSKSLDTNITFNNPSRFPGNLFYHATYTLPRVKINGNGYVFDKSITVDTKYYRYREFLAMFVAFVALVVSGNIKSPYAIIKSLWIKIRYIIARFR